MKFTVDRSKWRCGINGRHSHGTGPVKLRNEDGFQCCLGFVAEQLGASQEITRRCFYPRSLGYYGTEPNLLHEDFQDTVLAQAAAGINDHAGLTDKSRERKLKELFNEYGHHLEFVGEYAERREFEEERQ